MYLLFFVFWYFAGIHHRIQITSCWDVLAVFALDWLAVRDGWRLWCEKIPYHFRLSWFALARFAAWFAPKTPVWSANLRFEFCYLGRTQDLGKLPMCVWNAIGWHLICDPWLPLHRLPVGFHRKRLFFPITQNCVGEQNTGEQWGEQRNALCGLVTDCL